MVLIFSMVNNLPAVLHRLTYGFILHPIGAALGFIAVVFGIIGIAAASRFATIMMSMAAALGALVTLVVFVFDMVVFNILRNRVRSAGGDAMLVSFCLHSKKVRADLKGKRQLAHCWCRCRILPVHVHLILRCMRSIRQRTCCRREGTSDASIALMRC